MSATCSGCDRAANRNSEWMAANRALRVLIVTWRCDSRWSKKELTTVASRSSKDNFAGAIPARIKLDLDAAFRLPWDC